MLCGRRGREVVGRGQRGSGAGVEERRVRLASHGPLTCKYNSLIRKFASKFVTLTSLLLFSHRTSKLDCESDQGRRRDETEAGSGQHFGREKKKKKKKFPGNDPAFLGVVCTHQSLEAVDLIDACPGGEGKARQRSESARETRHLRSSGWARAKIGQDFAPATRPLTYLGPPGAAPCIL